MRTSAIERRSNNKNTPMQFIADIDDAKPEVRNHAKVLIKGGRSPSLRMKMPMHLWKTLGSPPYVDIVGTPEDGLKIVKGRETKVQLKVGSAKTGKDSIIIETSARKVGIVPSKRPVTQISIMFYMNALMLDPLPPEWCEYKPKVPEPKPIEADKAVLVDQSPRVEPEPEPVQLFAKMAVRRLSSDRPYTGIFFSIPTALAGELGDPQRYIINGSPHHGWTFTPCGPGEGVKITHASASNFYIQCGMTDRGIDKKERLGCQLEAYVKDGSIKIAGACKEWLDASGEYKPKDKPKIIPPATFHLSQTPANGAIPAPAVPPAPPSNGHHAAPNGNGNGHHSHVLDGLPKGNTGVEIAALMTRIQHTLSDVRMLRAELEKRSGLKFKLTSNLTFTLDV